MDTRFIGVLGDLPWEIAISPEPNLQAAPTHSSRARTHALCVKTRSDTALKHAHTKHHGSNSIQILVGLKNEGYSSSEHE